MTKFLHNKANRMAAVVMVGCAAVVGVFDIAYRVIDLF